MLQHSLAVFVQRGTATRAGHCRKRPGISTDRLVWHRISAGPALPVRPAFRASTRHHSWDGCIEIEVPSILLPKTSTAWHQRGQTDEIQFPVCNQYTIQADQFSLAILNNSPVPTPLSDAAANMKVIDALRASSTANAWVAIAK
jgi:hypothetical protein